MLNTFYFNLKDIQVIAYVRKATALVWKPGFRKRLDSAIRNERRISKRANKRIRKKAALGVLKLAIGLRDWYLARGWSVLWRFNEPDWHQIATSPQAGGEDRPDVEG